MWYYRTCDWNTGFCSSRGFRASHIQTGNKEGVLARMGFDLLRQKHEWIFFTKGMGGMK